MTAVNRSIDASCLRTLGLAPVEAENDCQLENLSLTSAFSQAVFFASTVAAATCKSKNSSASRHVPDVRDSTWVRVSSRSSSLRQVLFPKTFHVSQCRPTTLKPFRHNREPGIQSRGCCSFQEFCLVGTWAVLSSAYSFWRLSFEPAATCARVYASSNAPYQVTLVRRHGRGTAALGKTCSICEWS